MDAPRDFLIFLFFIFYFFSERAARAGGGGGVRCQTFFFPCSADHERDWPPCKVVFFGLATNALNVRNNNNNNFQHAHFIPIVGVGKRGAYQLAHGDLTRQHPLGTTLRFAGPVSADSRQ